VSLLLPDRLAGDRVEQLLDILQRRLRCGRAVGPPRAPVRDMDLARLLAVAKTTSAYGHIAALSGSASIVLRDRLALQKTNACAST